MEIALKKGDLTARVETLGGELVSLRDVSDTEYIWVGDPAYWGGAIRCCSPLSAV